MGISTHILDTALGRPATEVSISLDLLANGKWLRINECFTNADGRCPHLLPPSQFLRAGIYRVHFDTAIYFTRLQLPTLYPYVEVVFEIMDSEQHYHIPLLLTANGYTTYRGS
jgi:5-hydroxyisourate hydrolase